MKIAFFLNEKQQLEAEKTQRSVCGNNSLKVDYFLMEEKLHLAFERMGYDVIVLYPTGKEDLPVLIHEDILGLEQTKYMTFFNGKTCIYNLSDIFYLESYYRKTSVVIRTGKMRIKARLNEEENKLPKDWFIRINRHNIINMRFVKSVKDDEIEMRNGDVLYVNRGRKKKFEEHYKKFLKKNSKLV